MSYTQQSQEELLVAFINISGLKRGFYAMRGLLFTKLYSQSPQTHVYKSTTSLLQKKI